mgnify:CR=1 FL=1
MDITQRLRRWTISTDAVPASDLMDEAADEIERLRGVTESMPKEKRAEVSYTNHDAAPAAKAHTDADRDRSDKAAARPGEGTGNIPDSRTRHIGPELVARIRRVADSLEAVACTSDPQTTPGEGTSQGGCTLTDAEREAIERGADALDGIEDLSAGAVGADASAVFTLRSLLARTQTVRK